MSVLSLISGVVARIRSAGKATLHRDRLEAEMEAELAGHLEALTADLVRSGQSPQDAARNARIALGTGLSHKEGMRAAVGLKAWDEFRTDLRYGFRILVKSPGFTAIAAVSLALAIGANTTIFSVAKSLLYDRLNVPHADELRLLGWISEPHDAVHSMWGDFNSVPGGKRQSHSFSYPVYLALRDHNRVMQDLFAYQEDSMNATIRGNAQRVDVDMVSGNFYDALGVRTQLGRPIVAADDAVGATPVAVISDGVWSREFGRSADVLGQSIVVNQSRFVIIGVNPKGFTGAKNVMASPDVFVPVSMQPVIDPKGKNGSLLNDPNLWWANIMGRAKPGVTDAQAQAALNVELAAATRATLNPKPDETIPMLQVADGGRGLNFVGHMFEKPIAVLMTLTGFVLLLACANIANLLLARGAQRQREMSVRLALGAGRARILRQLLTESLMLAAIGGAGGLALGYMGRNVIPKLMTDSWERTQINVPMDWGVFAFSAGITLITGLLFGLAPAWLAARSEVSSSLKESAQTVTKRRKGLGGKAIVAFQIALSTLLVVGAGLFLRTLVALTSIDVGFRTDHLILFEVAPPVRSYGPGKDIQLHLALEQGFGALPGVKGITLTSTPYIANNMSNDDFLPEGEKDNHDSAEFSTAVGTSFFETMGIPVIAGRGFGPHDTATSEHVAVINQALAKKRFRGVNPVGKKFKNGDEKPVWTRIVGICADTRYANLRDDSPPQYFEPYAQQHEVGSLTYAVRTSLSPGELAPAIRRVVQQRDRDLPVIDMRTQREQIDASLQMERVFGALTSGFGVLALALACVGIYGVMAYSVANRRNEIGIRLALGAQPGQVRGMILRESTWIALVGVAVGVGGALTLTRLVKSMLYGIQPNDPLTMIAGVSVLLAIALAASWIPARRAAAVQPMEALRHE